MSHRIRILPVLTGECLLVAETHLPHANSVDDRVQETIEQEQIIEVLGGIQKFLLKLLQNVRVNVRLNNERDLKQTRRNPTDTERSENEQGRNERLSVSRAHLLITGKTVELPFPHFVVDPQV